MSFGLVALAALMVVALAVFASPLLAVAIAAAAAVFLLIGMSALRQRSAAKDGAEGGAPGRARTGNTGRRPSGEPASGEG